MILPLLMQLPPNQHNQPGVPNYTTSFDDIYNELVQPLKAFNGNLNTMSGMLDFLSIMKTVSNKFDHVFTAAMENAIEKWPEQKNEMEYYVLTLKKRFMQEHGGQGPRVRTS